jgi:hypothetical protein
LFVRGVRAPVLRGERRPCDLVRVTREACFLRRLGPIDTLDARLVDAYLGGLLFFARCVFFFSAR